MANKKQESNKVYRESKTLDCTGCKEPVKHVDSQAVSVLCWKCSTKLPPAYSQEKNKKK